MEAGGSGCPGSVLRTGTARIPVSNGFWKTKLEDFYEFNLFYMFLESGDFLKRRWQRVVHHFFGF